VKIRRSKHFKKSYQKLSPVLQKRVDKALMLLAMNVRHPSLRVKKIQGTDDIYELRVTRSYRISFEIEDDGYFLRRVGKHDDLLRRP